MSFNRGSEWLRWDVHIHTPGTALANQYPPNSWDEYIDRINRARPEVIALGVTDYFSLRGYKRLRERWTAGRLPGVRYFFPNVEFRVSPPTQKHRGVNLHLLIDADAHNHVELADAALARLSFEYHGKRFNCDEAGLTAFGRECDPTKSGEAAYSHGVNEFKVDFSVFRDWLRGDPWLEAHSLVAVSSDSKDGVTGLPPNQGCNATMEEMLGLAHVIFSGNPTNRDYWLRAPRA